MAWFKRIAFLVISSDETARKDLGLLIDGDSNLLSDIQRYVIYKNHNLKLPKCGLKGALEPALRNYFENTENKNALKRSTLIKIFNIFNIINRKQENELLVNELTIDATFDESLAARVNSLINEMSEENSDNFNLKGNEKISGRHTLLSWKHIESAYDHANDADVVLNESERLFLVHCISSLPSVTIKSTQTIYKTISDLGEFRPRILYSELSSNILEQWISVWRQYGNNSQGASTHNRKNINSSEVSTPAPESQWIPMPWCGSIESTAASWHSNHSEALRIDEVCQLAEALYNDGLKCGHRIRLDIDNTHILLEGLFDFTLSDSTNLSAIYLASGIFRKIGFPWLPPCASRISIHIPETCEEILLKSLKLKRT